VLTKKGQILVIDSDNCSLSLTEAMLCSLGYQVTLAHSGSEGLEKVSRSAADLILLDVLTGEMNEFEVVRRLKENATTKVIPVIVMTAVTAAEARAKALAAGVDDFLTKPVEEAEVQARLNSLLKVKAYHEHMLSFQTEVEAEVVRRTEALAKALEKIKAASLDTVYRLSRAAEYKDEDTGAHVQRMSHYSSAMARAKGFDDEFVERVLWAAPMHDIGKIGIPDRILQKPGKLEPDEWTIMRQHTIIGSEILKDASADFIKLASSIALSHHEKWDGSGYPQGTKSTDIPIAGRIVALADVFDALTSDRVYRPAMPMEKALSIIREGRGSHFDPELVDAFCSIEDEIRAELKWWKFLSSDSTPADMDLSDLFGESETSK